MGEEIKVDEYEGCVRSPVLHGLAQSVRHTRSREGQSLPVCGVRRAQEELDTDITIRVSFCFPASSVS